MTTKEYRELLEYHLKRAKEKEYDALTVETKVIERAYHELLRYTSNGYYANTECEEGTREN